MTPVPAQAPPITASAGTSRNLELLIPPVAVAAPGPAEAPEPMQIAAAPPISLSQTASAE